MIVRSEKFIPHKLEHLTKVRAFPNPLPEAFYENLKQEYAALNDVISERIIYKSDGLNVTGLFVRPALIMPKSHPILIYNRGGSRDYGMLTLLSVMRSMAPFAKDGYLAYASNYRGNDGGEGQEEFGGAEVNDILNLVDIAKQNSGWDGKNIFLLGHSRGGMMNALAMKRGLKVNAAVSLAAISDAHRFTSAPTMVDNVFKRLIPGYAENPDAIMRDRSPLDWPELISAPLLLLHGDNDKDVHYSDSEKLAAALTQLGKPNELVIYEGGNHALIRVWDDVLAKTKAWFARYHISTAPSPSQGEGRGEGKI